MRQFEITRQLFGLDITAHVLPLDKGLHVSLFGGELPHIGAVSIVGPAGQCSTVQFPGHRDGVISEQWAEGLVQAGYCPVVVEAGIHYDDLSRDGITAVLALTEKMLASILDTLSNPV